MRPLFHHAAMNRELWPLICVQNPWFTVAVWRRELYFGVSLCSSETICICPWRKIDGKLNQLSMPLITGVHWILTPQKWIIVTLLDSWLASEEETKDSFCLFLKACDWVHFVLSGLFSEKDNRFVTVYIWFRIGKLRTTCYSVEKKSKDSVLKELTDFQNSIWGLSLPWLEKVSQGITSFHSRAMQFTSWNDGKGESALN